MQEVSSLALLSLSLFVLTAMLLAWATRLGATYAGRLTALAAVLVSGVAIYTMFLTYEGEKELVFERPGPLEKRPIQRRQNVVWAEREEAEAEDDGRSRRSGSSGAAGVPTGEGEQDASAGAHAGTWRSRLFGIANSGLPVAPFDATFRDCDDCPEMVVVGAGYFVMGASVDDEDALQSEMPRRTIKVPRRFAISRTEVTTRSFMTFVRETGHVMAACSRPVASSGGNNLADCVSWRDAMAYAAWLGMKTQRTYRLPTEAEWEWAARAGSRQRFVTGRMLTASPSNAFGLEGIHSGVAEIVAGCWTPDLEAIPGDASKPARRGSCHLQVLRDGSDQDGERQKRLSARRPVGVDEKRPGMGFRVVREM